MAEITEADVTAAVTKAVADKEAELQAQITDLQAKLDSRDTESKVADLQRQLDAEAIARKAAEDRLTDTVAFLTAEQARLEDEARIEAAKAERIQAVRDLELFPDDQLEARIEANADRWAAMDADQWGEQLADYQAMKARIVDALGASQNPAGEAKDPGQSALGAGASVKDTDDNGETRSLVTDVLSNRYAITGRI